MIVSQLGTHAAQPLTPEERRSDLISCGCSTLLIISSITTKLYKTAPVRTFFFAVGSFSGAVLAQNLLRHYTFFRFFKVDCSTLSDRTHVLRGLLLVVAMIASRVFPTLGLVMAVGVGCIAGLGVRM